MNVGWLLKVQRLWLTPVLTKRLGSARRPNRKAVGDDIVWTAWKHAEGCWNRAPRNISYGGSSYGFFMDQNMPQFSKNKWESIVNKFWDKYQGLKDWQDKNVQYANTHEGRLISPTGRFFIFDKDPKGGYSRRQICNYPVQSLATADIMPMAMCLIGAAMRKKGYKSIMIGQVHDSILFDVVDSELKGLAGLCVSIFRSLPKYLERMFVFKWNVPLDGDVEYGRNYQELQKLEL